MINNALKLIRKYHNRTLTETAEDIGVSKSYLSELENGKKTPSIEVLKSYSDAFGMPLSSILFFAENQETGERERKLKRAIGTKALKMLDWLDTISR